MSNLPDLYRRNTSLAAGMSGTSRLFDAMSLRDQRITARQFGELVRIFEVTEAADHTLGLLVEESEGVFLEVLERVWWRYQAAMQRMPGLDQDWLFEQFYAGAADFRSDMMQLLAHQQRQVNNVVAWQPDNSESAIKSAIKDFLFWLLKQVM